MNKYLIIIITTLVLTSCSQKQFKLYLRCDNAQGIDLGTKVSINGKKSGEIINLEFDTNYDVILEVEFEKNVKIPIGSKFNLISTDVLGTKEIIVDKSNNSLFIENYDTLKLNPETPINSDLLLELTEELIENNPVTNYLDSLQTQLENINQKLDKKN